MTEEEWQRSDDGHEMLVWFRGNWRGGDAELFRLVRRYWLACCRRIWKLLSHKDSRRSLEVMERYLDGTASIEEFVAAEWQAEGATYYIQYGNGFLRDARWAKEIGEIPPDQLRRMVRKTHWGEELEPIDILWYAARFAHRSFCLHNFKSDDLLYLHKPFLSASLLREIVGNPLRDVAIDPEWRSPDVLKLARVIHQERAFDRMPILGDALEELGCSDLTILDHCREPVDHVRGCWVISALLEKGQSGYPG